MAVNFFTGLPDDESSEQTPQSTATAESPAPAQGVGDYAVDVARGLVGGARDAIQGTINTVLTGAEAVSNASPLTTDANRGAVAQTYKDIRSKLSFSEVEENTTGLGRAIRGIAQFGLGFGIAGKALKAVPGFTALKAGGVAGRLGAFAVQGGVGDFTVADPHAERLANLVESVPWLANPATELIAAKEDDSEAMGKFKAGIEGAVAGVLSDALIMALGKGIKATAKAVRLRNAGKVAEADELLAKSGPEMEKALKEASEQKIDIAINPKARGEAELLAEKHGLEYQGKAGEGVVGPGGEDLSYHEFRDTSRIDPKTGEVTHVNIGVKNLGEIEADLAKFENNWNIASKAEPVEEAARYPKGSSEGIEGSPMPPKEGMVRLFRGMEPGDKAGRFASDSAEGAGSYTGSGRNLHFVDVPKAEAERLRVSNAPKHMPESEVKLTGEPTREFFLRDEDVSRLKEFYGDAPVEAVQRATAKVGDPVQTLKAVQEIEVIRWKRIAGKAPELEGPLNYDKFSSSDDVKQFMSELVKRTKTELPDLLGSYQSQKETADLASIMGKDSVDLYTSLSALRMSNEDLAAHILAGKNLIKRSVEDTYTFGQKISNGGGTEIDFVQMMHMSDVTLSLMDHVSSLQTAAARATAAGRIKVTGGITRENYAKLLQEYGGYESVKKLADRIAGTEGDIPGIVGVIKGTPSIAEKVTSVHNFLWMNGVLSGLKTMVVNPTTTGFNAMVMPGFRMVGGLMQEVLGGDGSRQMMEGLYQYKYFTSAFADSIAWAWKSFKANGSMLDQASNPLAQQGYHNPISMDFLAPDATVSTGLRNLVDWTGHLFGAPGRILTTQDEFFKQLTYRTHVMASAHVDGVKQGLDGQALQDFVNKKLTDSISTAGKALDEGALKAGKMATFTQDLEARSWWRDSKGNERRSILESVASFSGSHPVVKGLILPFVKVPANLFRQAQDMTPLAFARKQVIEDIKAGGEAGAMTLGKIGAGTAFWGTAVTLAVNGRITGAGPRDPDLRRQLGPDWLPYSVHVSTNADGTKNYVSFERADPYGMFFGLAADFAEIAGHMNGAEQENWAVSAVTSVLHNLSSKTYLRGLTDITSAMQGDDASLTKYMKSRAASYVPGVVQVFNPDVEIKETRGGNTLTQMLKAVQQRVPGWSDSLEAKRDNFGEKIMPPMGYPYTAFNPYKFHRTTDDPVRKELADLARSDSEAKFALPNPILAGPKGNQVDLRLIKNAEGQSAYDRWLEMHTDFRIGGKTLHESVATVIASPTYQKYRAVMGEGDAVFKDSFAVDLIQQQFDLYEQVTWLKLAKEYPGLAPAKLKYSIGKSQTRFKGPSAGTPIDQLRDLAGQNK